MSARAFIHFACLAVGLPPGVTELARHGLVHAWMVVAGTWRRRQAAPLRAPVAGAGAA